MTAIAAIRARLRCPGRKVAGHGLLSERMIALAAVGLLVAGCFSNPGNFLWVENETSAEILLRYEVSAA